MAGALGLCLAGPRVYGGTTVDDAYMGDGRRDATADDIRAALALYRRADMVLAGLLAAVTVVAVWPG
jgi:adenosylcobinamide-phosphate synthase